MFRCTMTISNVDRDQLPDLRRHYENVAARVWSSIRRDWRLIASVVALTMAVTFAVLPLLPRQYSATAVVYPNLFSSDHGKSVPLGAVDAGTLVTSEARLIVSDTILRAVVKRIDWGGKPALDESRSWLSPVRDGALAMFFPESRDSSPFDRQVASLRNKVEVAKDTRSYLISITFAAPFPDEAARVVNAIALEYLREKQVTRAKSAVAAADGELSRHLAVYGEKHPKVLQAQDGVEAARAGLNAVTSTDLAEADESIKLAMPNRTATSPKGFVIAVMSFVLSLLVGIALAVWREQLGFLTRFVPRLAGTRPAE
jgi:uncharacterized protein involved in exopolysaccharide biosynthesis